MEKFKIPITWEVCGEVEIEAETLDEAVERVDFDPDEVVVPEEWEIVEGSVNTNFEMVEILNPGHKLNREPYSSELECDDSEEREARRHLEGIGEGYQEDTEEEGGDEEG